MRKPKRADDTGQPKSQMAKTLNVDFAKIGKSKRLTKQNKAYLDLLSIVEKSRRGFAVEQTKLQSKPAKDAARQLLRQLDLIFHMVQLPYVILMMMEGYATGLQKGFEIVLRRGKPKHEDSRKTFEKLSKRTMQRFFAIDVSGSLSRPWLFAVTLYIWTAYECLAGDLWSTSLNQATGLGHRILTSIRSEDPEKLGISRRHIDVGLAARYGFDLRHSLGTILKAKFEFSSFDGIKAAYTQAFGTCGELEDQRDALKELEQVRHLIMHRGGIADPRFVTMTKIKTRPNSMLSLKLAQVAEYMMSMTMGCVALLHVVDDWFAQQGASSGGDGTAEA
jgi:hypothetical protein